MKTIRFQSDIKQILIYIELGRRINLTWKIDLLRREEAKVFYEFNKRVHN